MRVNLIVKQYLLICESVNWFIFFFKQKTAYEIVSRDWSSDVCSSDLVGLWLKANFDILFSPGTESHSGLLSFRM